MSVNEWLEWVDDSDVVCTCFGPKRCRQCVNHALFHKWTMLVQQTTGTQKWERLAGKPLGLLREKEAEDDVPTQIVASSLSWRNFEEGQDARGSKRLWHSLTEARRAEEVSNVGHRGEGTEMTVGYHSKTSRQLFPQTFYSPRGKPPIHRNVHT